MSSPTRRGPPPEGPKHRACDECRTRKLACSKEADGCSRCKRDGVKCHYSLQKPMGRPRKTKRESDVQNSRASETQPDKSHQPWIMPASDSAMDLDLDLAFFDMNDVNFLDLAGPEYSLALDAPQPHMGSLVSEPPKEISRQARSPGAWQVMSTEHLAQDIDFNYRVEPMAVAEEVSAERVAHIMTTEPPETLSVPALSPAQQSSSSDSSNHPSPSDHQSQPHPHPHPHPQSHIDMLQQHQQRRQEQPALCSCLASLYLALDSLQHLPADACSAIHVTRSASKTAYNTIKCPICSNPAIDSADLSGPPPIQSLQNMMMLGALLPSLSNAYKTILRLVDEEAHSANFMGRKLRFDLSSYGGLWGSIASHDSLCGASANVDGRELDPAMWRLTVRALLKIDVYGLNDCTPGRAQLADKSKPDDRMWQPGLKDIIQMMEERSRARHEQVDALVAAGLLQMDGRCNHVPLNNATGEKPTCLRIIEDARKSMQSLVIP